MSMARKIIYGMDFYSGELPGGRSKEESERLHNEIDDAIKRFTERGGIIQKLPEEIVPNEKRARPGTKESPDLSYETHPTYN